MLPIIIIITRWIENSLLGEDVEYKFAKKKKREVNRLLFRYHLKEKRTFGCD